MFHSWRFEPVVAKMLTRDINERYQTPGEVAAALEEFAYGAILPV